MDSTSGDLELFHNLVQMFYPRMEKCVSTDSLYQIISIAEFMIMSITSQDSLKFAIQTIAEALTLPLDVVTPYVTTYCIGRISTFSDSQDCHQCGSNHSTFTKVVVKTSTGHVLMTQIGQSA